MNLKALYCLSLLILSPCQGAPLHWLDVNAPTEFSGTTWGMPWARGQVQPDATFRLKAEDGTIIALQSWPLATWPDGSLKWTGHALAPTEVVADGYQLEPGRPIAPKQALTLQQTNTSIDINTGPLQCSLAKHGSHLITSLQRRGQALLTNGRLVLLRQDRAVAPETGPLNVERFVSHINRVTVEQNGPVRAVVKIEGKHAQQTSGRAWLPFVVRLYFYADSDDIRILHTIIYDGDEHQDFIRGLGLRFDLPQSASLQDRHIRFVGEDNGVFAEAVRGLTGLRHGPGWGTPAAQVAGESTGNASFGRNDYLNYIPAFGDYTLLQPNADGFTLRKRTRDGHAWLDSGAGRRSEGVGYLGSPDGGLAFGIRNFWQSHPAQIDIRNAVTDTAEVTLWLWAPQAGAMDLRFYHDGLGQDTYAQQLEGLKVTYEDYEPGFGTPMGVARTSELMLWALDATPDNTRLADLAASLQTPARLMCSPKRLSETGVFGPMVTPIKRDTEAQIQLEDLLDFYFTFYQNQVTQRHWTGFWNYGDVMHDYDLNRHVWKYDVGGYAWDNSELSTDLWLWFYFLHTGRADVFRMAEAMTRHTGEVDVHHLGRFAPLGSRHNVMHWGCSAKQLRISTAANRRYYYYLTADERVGDLMREQIEGLRTLKRVLATRKLPVGQRVEVNPNDHCVGASFGTDWGAIAAAWLTEWERTGDPAIRDRLFNSMKTIATQPYGFFSESGRLDPDTGKFVVPEQDQPSVSHLSAVFGLTEICSELVNLVDMPAFTEAWLQYCRLYNAGNQAQAAELGRGLNSRSLSTGHARLTALAAAHLNDPDLATRAWNEFYGSRNRARLRPVRTRIMRGPDVLNTVEEVPGLSTNAVAQWGLSALQCLALIGDAQPTADGN